MVTITGIERLKSQFEAVRSLKLSLAPIVAVGGGTLIALLFLLMPTNVLEGLVSASGVPAILAAAEPPLGVTARIALALLFGGGFAASAWFGLSLFAGGGAMALGRPVINRAAAAMRRADIHPDAPPRPPLFANRDLGAPRAEAPAEYAPLADTSEPGILAPEPVFAEVEIEPVPVEPDTVEPDPAPTAVVAPVERPLPRDLDQPLAAFDPIALGRASLLLPDPPAPGARPALIDPGDRFETFELTPFTRSEPLSLRVPPAGSTPIDPEDDYDDYKAMPDDGPVVKPATEATVHDLLARLERGLAGRMPDAPTGNLQDTLGDLRRLATGG